MRLLCLLYICCILMYYCDARYPSDLIDPGSIKTRKLLAIGHGSTDDCGKPLQPIGKIVRCHKAFSAKAFKSTCKSYPSQPRNVKHSFHFDKEAKDLSLEVTWGEPEYGQSTLWGYDVLLCDDHYRSQRCYQINGKESNDRNFTFDKIKFGIPYLIIITTLPRRNGKMTNSLEKEIKSPDQCEIYEKEKLKLPVSCHKIKNLRLEQPCNASGVALVSWDKPFVAHDHVVIEVFSSCSRDIIDLAVGENVTSIWLTRLKLGCKYFARIQILKLAQRAQERSKQENITFSCKGFKQSVNTKLEYHKKESQHIIKIVIYIVPSSFVIFIAAGIGLFLMFRRRKRNLERNFQRMRAQNIKSSSFRTEIVKEYSDLRKKEDVTVMIVHSSGCEDLKEFVLLFANLLNTNGISVRLDLLECGKISETGTAVYYEETERESDYVIIVCTEDLEATSSDYNKPLKFILNIIRNNILNSGNSAKYIPVYVDDLRFVPASLQGIARKVPDEFHSIIERLHDIPRYQLMGPGCQNPVKNDIIIDSRLLKNLRLSATNLIQSNHERCDINSCSKVKELLDHCMAKGSRMLAHGEIRDKLSPKFTPFP